VPAAAGSLRTSVSPTGAIAERIERTRAAVAEERTQIAREVYDRDPQLASRPMQRVQSTERDAIVRLFGAVLAEQYDE
jgi:hypothetical protein